MEEDHYSIRKQAADLWLRVKQVKNKDRIAAWGLCLFSVAIMGVKLYLNRDQIPMRNAPGYTFDISPDGTQIVFSGAGRNDTRDLYLYNLTTSKVTRLTDTDEDEAEPAFSPTGERIAYISTNDPYGKHNLCLCSRDGSNVTLFAADEFAADSNPTFSHDGKYLAFARARQVLSPSSRKLFPWSSSSKSIFPWRAVDISLMNLKTLKTRRLTSLSLNRVVRPQFDRDDQHLLFEGGEYLASVSTREKGKIVYFPSLAGGTPRLFPDGKRVVFVSREIPDGVSDLLLGDLRGATPTRLNLTRYNAQNYCPRVSPDGKRIYYLQGYVPELWAVDVEGRNAVKIAGKSLMDDPMHWPPGQ